MEQMQFEVILQRLKMIEDKITKLEQQPAKAYVVSSDVKYQTLERHPISIDIDTTPTHTN